jgi:uncharacterized membrane-anchored protein
MELNPQVGAAGGLVVWWVLFVWWVLINWFGGCLPASLLLQLPYLGLTDTCARLLTAQSMAF